ncbi:hypothetical protein ACIBJF_27170 [Streptomyces sp. NPDC050743]|uniref:Vgb family protein n=1 Tax=Streptomyces sp. NPDC050743 TaxID=3365634 RepID=UPI0037905D34
MPETVQPGSRTLRLCAAVLGALIGVTAVAAPARAEGGAVTEYPVTTAADSIPSGLTSGPDRALWFTENAAGRIGRIALDGTVTDFPTSGPDTGPTAITQGPDRALWFTETRANRIGRINSSGRLTEFPVPTAGSGPAGIALGPDRAVWFTELIGNAIGRVRSLRG